MNIDPTLTSFAKRGTLTYIKPNYEFETVEGWFYLRGQTVVRRKIRGRNEYQFCNASLVHSFVPYVKAGL